MKEKTLPRRQDFVRKVMFESFGARILLESNSKDLFEKALERARKALLGHVRIIDNPEETRADFRFGLELDDDGIKWLDQNGLRTSYDGSEFIFLKSFDAMVRLRVAENAVDRVFVHAGVVGWKGRAVMVPALSHKGKSTLVAELIRNGAEYYSDEYALLDRTGRVHPFPRDLMIRRFGKEGTERLLPPEYFGGSIGSNSIPVGAVLFTEYRKGAKWHPTELTVGQGIMETIPHTIPVHLEPQFSLEVLNKAYKGAIIARSFRGDAKNACPKIIAFLDDHLN